MSEIVKRDLFEATKGRFRTVEHLEAPLALLVEYGYLRLREEAEGGKRAGRKPAPTYEVNPLSLRTIRTIRRMDADDAPPF